MPRTFSSPFMHYLVPSEDAVKTALLGGLVVFDTNVLLSTYRFAPDGREQLLSAMERMRDRVWVPHRVGLEFHRRRLEVIADQRAAYSTALNVVEKHKSALSKDMRNAILHLARRAALTDRDKQPLLELLEASLEPLGEIKSIIGQLDDNHDAIGIHEDDAIILRLQEIFGENVGEDFTTEERAEAMTEATNRKDEKLPPGFKDADKEEFFGDYFVWRQALAEAGRRSATHLLFVTDDQKEDWYLTVKGKHLADPRLAEEVTESCGAQLVMMNSETLLRHARDYLNADVSSETLRQAGELREAASGRELLARAIADQNQFHSLGQSAITHRLQLMHRIDLLDSNYHNLEASLDEAGRYEAKRPGGELDVIAREQLKLMNQFEEAQKQEADLHASIQSTQRTVNDLQHLLDHSGIGNQGKH